MTTASLHRKMVEALRHVLACASRADCGGCEDCHEVVGAALEGWEKRPRLRDQPELRKAVSMALGRGQMQTQDVCDQAAALDRDRAAVRILDTLEPLLFGERG